MENVVPFPKTPDRKVGSVESKHMRITCRNCGNTDRFYGKALVNPFIVVKKKTDTTYEVAEVGYKRKDGVEELVEACASCGSNDLNIEELITGAK